MSAQIIPFPNRLVRIPQKTEYQVQFERVVDLLRVRAGCSMEKASAALTQAILFNKP